MVSRTDDPTNQFKPTARNSDKLWSKVVQLFFCSKKNMVSTRQNGQEKHAQLAALPGPPLSRGRASGAHCPLLAAVVGSSGGLARGRHPC